jgi:hypothetical protein
VGIAWRWQGFTTRVTLGRYFRGENQAEVHGNRADNLAGRSTSSVIALEAFLAIDV